ncbi:MAG: hypothetical protein QOI42_1311, partial [Frankiaceae bacterium]|nr:hypothetical protein [Frankiaceae bacterium]
SISCLGALPSSASQLRPAAHAAADKPISPVLLDPNGDQPNVSLDAAGNAYVAWRGRGSSSAQLYFCRFPRGAGACAARSQIAAPGDSLSLPLAFLDGSAIRVISYRYGLSGSRFSQTMMFTSTDGGASFDGGVAVGTIDPWDYAFGPAGRVSAINNATTLCTSCYQAIALDGSTAGVASTPLSPDGSHPYSGTVTMLDANTPLAVFASGNGDGQFRRYSGAGDVNDQASWTPPADIGTLDSPHLVSGPSGVFLIAQDQLSGPNMQARRFDGATFGARAAITSGAHSDHATEDALGRIHVVAQDIGGSGLRYATSDNGALWATRTIKFTNGHLPGAMRLAVAADHIGFVVGTYALGDPGVWINPIGPTADQPRLGKSAKLEVISGTVLVKVPGGKGFSRLTSGDVIPVGSIVDATNGRVRVTTVLPGGKLQSADFYQGIFKLAQAKSGLATMSLFGGSFKSCGGAARAGGAVAAKSSKAVRHLWAAGKGKYRTKGRFAAATIRGTTWNTIDRCDGTQIKVTKGTVAVTDFKRHKTIVVKKGHSYLAKG